MVQRYYIQDYPENFRGNTETRTIASDFIRPTIESSLTRRGKKTAQIRSVVRAGGFLQGKALLAKPNPDANYFYLMLGELTKIGECMTSLSK